MNLNVFYGILIPFVGTSAGAACVFFMKKDLRQWMQRCLTGFAAGVMVAAVRGNGEAVVCAGSPRILGGCIVFAFTGSYYSTPASTN